METSSPALSKPFFLLPTAKGVEFIDVNNIIRIEALSNYSKLYFRDGKPLVVAKVLKWFEGSLSVEQFIRVHSKHLVNEKYIRQYINADHGKLKLLNGDLVDISRRKKSLVLRFLYNHAGCSN